MKEFHYQNSEDAPHSRSLRLHRRKEGSGCWFVTKCLQPKKKILGTDAAALISSALAFHKKQGRIHLGAFVVMPDHWHALIATKDGESISDFMRSIDRWITKNTGVLLREHVCEWQRGFYETRVKSVRQFQFVRNYIELNPVRAGTAPTREEWAFSTANESYRDAVTCPWPFRFEDD